MQAEPREAGGDTEQLLEALLAEEGASEDPYLHYRCANFYARKNKNFEKSVHHYKLACQLHDAFGDAWNSLGLAYRSEATKVMERKATKGDRATQRDELLQEAASAFQKGIVLTAQAGNGFTYFSAIKNLARTQKDLGKFDLAEKLARTCFEMYNRTSTGLAPEIAVFNKVPGSDFIPDKPASMCYMECHGDLVRRFIRNRRLNFV